MVRFIPLDPTEEDSIAFVLASVDNAMQFGEDAEPKMPRDDVDDETAEASRRIVELMTSGDTKFAIDAGTLHPRDDDE
jgi:hypothetical protein